MFSAAQVRVLTFLEASILKCNKVINTYIHVYVVDNDHRNKLIGFKNNFLDMALSNNWPVHPVIFYYIQKPRNNKDVLLSVTRFWTVQGSMIFPVGMTFSSFIMLTTRIKDHGQLSHWLTDPLDLFKFAFYAWYRECQSTHSVRVIRNKNY